MPIGEHSPSMGMRIGDGLRWLGLKLGEAANTVFGPTYPGRDQAPSHDGLMTIDGQSRAAPQRSLQASTPQASRTSAPCEAAHPPVDGPWAGQEGGPARHIP